MEDLIGNFESDMLTHGLTVGADHDVAIGIGNKDVISGGVGH